MDKVDEYVEKNKDRFIEELRAFVKQPSISAEGVGINEASALLVNYLKRVGVDAKAESAEDGNPIVYGMLRGETERTLLVYGHYDVQPVGRLEEWICDPFSAEMRDGKIYGRGVIDDKGNLFSWIKAVESLLKVEGKVPVNILFMFEGEEEIGSPTIDSFLSKNLEFYRKADAAILFDVRQLPDERPILSLGWKGMLYIEMEAQGPPQDLHSFNAPIAENPAWKLIRALQTFRSDDRILIDGFYDNVEEFSKEDMAVIAELPIDQNELATSLGLKKFRRNLSGVKLFEALITEPTCNIAGLVSGYTGKGSKTIIPAKATAKLDFRLVPNQDPEDIFAKVRAHLDRQGFSDVRLTKLGAIKCSRTPIKEKIVDATQKAVMDVFKLKPAIYPLIPGSAPSANISSALGGIPFVASGIGFMHLAHRPNEYITIEQYLQGIKLATQVLRRFSES